MPGVRSAHVQSGLCGQWDKGPKARTWTWKGTHRAQAPNKVHVGVPRPHAEHVSCVTTAALPGLSPFVTVPGPSRGLALPVSNPQTCDPWTQTEPVRPGHSTGHTRAGGPGNRGLGRRGKLSEVVASSQKGFTLEAGWLTFPEASLSIPPQVAAGRCHVGPSQGELQLCGRLLRWCHLSEPQSSHLKVIIAPATCGSMGIK